MNVRDTRESGLINSVNMLKLAVEGTAEEANVGLGILEETAIHILAHQAINRGDARAFSHPVSETKSIMYFKERIEETITHIKGGKEHFVQIGEKKDEPSPINRKSD